MHLPRHSTNRAVKSLKYQALRAVLIVKLHLTCILIILYRKLGSVPCRIVIDYPDRHIRLFFCLVLKTNRRQSNLALILVFWF